VSNVPCNLPGTQSLKSRWAHHMGRLSRTGQCGPAPSSMPKCMSTSPTAAPARSRGRSRS
jgi:hypothetical protein